MNPPTTSPEVPVGEVLSASLPAANGPRGDMVVTDDSDLERCTLPPAVPDVPIYRLSVAQYHRMVRAGILVDDDPVELLEGWLVQKMGKKPPHTFSTEQVRDTLPHVLPPGWFVSSQQPVTGETSEPEPDVAVVRGNRRDYLERHPEPRETGILVEVPDSTLRHDRGFKKRIYARDRIPVYWIVNLVDRQVEVYTDPTWPADVPDYRQRQDYKPGEDVPVVIDGQEVGRIPVAELLP